MIDQTWKEMYKAAKEVQNSCKISNHMEAGGIAATVLSASNRIPARFQIIWKLVG